MHTWKRIEHLLWAIGLAALGGCLAIALLAQHDRVKADVLDSPAPSAAASTGDAVIGRLDIPALHLSTAVLRDYDPRSLLRGVGHIPGTAQPGGFGTVGLAGHRDTFFRPLRRVLPHMDIRLTDQSGTYHYSVDSTQIVTPDQIQVLAIASRPGLTLITCYPFDYVGPAPRRFIVHAHLVSALPDPQ